MLSHFQNYRYSPAIAFMLAVMTSGHANEAPSAENPRVISFEMLRHGQTALNAAPGGALFQGRTDDADTQLDEKGKTQSAKAGLYIVNLIEKGEVRPYTKIICSDLGRAYETATIVQTIIKDQLGYEIPIEKEAGLRAMNWGIYERTPMSQTYSDLEDLPVKDYAAKYPDWKPENGESKNDMTTRIFSVISKLSESTDTDHILYVVHNENIKVLSGESNIPNCGFAGFEYHLDDVENPIQYKWIKNTQE